MDVTAKTDDKLTANDAGTESVNPTVQPKGTKGDISQEDGEENDNAKEDDDEDDSDDYDDEESESEEELPEFPNHSRAPIKKTVIGIIKKTKPTDLKDSKSPAPATADKAEGSSKKSTKKDEKPVAGSSTK